MVALISGAGTNRGRGVGRQGVGVLEIDRVLGDAHEGFLERDLHRRELVQDELLGGSDLADPLRGQSENLQRAVIERRATPPPAVSAAANACGSAARTRTGAP